MMAFHKQPPEQIFICEKTVKSKEKRIGFYTKEIRKQKIARYKAKIQKFKDKSMNKTVYDCRKKVADRRIRIKGRFIRNEDAKKFIMQLLGNYFAKMPETPDEIKDFNIKLSELLKNTLGGD